MTGSRDASTTTRSVRNALGLIVVVLAAGTVIAGYVHYCDFERRYRAEVERGLCAIADLKVADLADWRRERLNDASVLFGNDAFSALVRRLFDKPEDLEAQNHLRSWLGQLLAHPSYDQVLNELRFKKDSALRLRVSAKDGKELPAVKAVLGQQGIVSGLDYRGVPVTAAIRAVPDSPWFLVARVDTSEVYGPLRGRLWVTIALVGVLLLAVSAGVGLAWRKQSVHFDRKKAEIADALRVSEVRYRRLFDAAKDGILILDAQTGMVIEANPFLTELLGFPREHFLARKIWELGFLKDVVANQASYVELQRKGCICHEDMPLETADGRRIDVEFVSSVYEVNHRQVIQCSVRDVTDRKHAERLLRAKSEEAARMNIELTRFTYTVSHDLKSPLVTIKGFLGYVEKDAASGNVERMRKDLAYIHEAADKMARLLDELLVFSRVGHKSNPPEEVPLQAVVKEALGLVAGQIAARGVQVQVTEEPVGLYGDRPRLVEVFQNLLDNAVKFMGDQPNPRVEVGAETAAEGTVLFVRDNGIGIDPRHQAKVFGLFEKLDPHMEGSGLGLALVHRMVEVHGGRIWVESAGAGKGTTFRFTLGKTADSQTKGNQP